MSDNTLVQAVVGKIVEALHINQIVSALGGSFMGRNSSGAPASGQNLGTSVYPWGTAYINNLNLQGNNVNQDIFESKANRIVSGKTRSTSGQPDFLRADGATNAFTIQATATALELVIDDESVTISSDIVVTGLQTQPANNTAAISAASLSDQEASKYISEDERGPLIDLGTVGSGITDRVGFFGAFETVSGEIMFALIRSGGDLAYSFRGYFFDENGDPVSRETLNTTDSVTMRELGWIFIQATGGTVDVSYVTPIASGTEPTLGLDGNALTDGQYWFDIENDTWKRYSTSSATFEQLNRILLGLCVMDGSNCVATRSFDFTKFYDIYNTIELYDATATTIESRSAQNIVSVYGAELDLKDTLLIFDLAADMESGVSLTVSTRYYLYLSDIGTPVISDIKYYRRQDLRGFYHPYNNWRAVGEFLYNGSSAIREVRSYKDSQESDLTISQAGTDFADYISPLKTAKYKIPLGGWDMNADIDHVIGWEPNDGTFITDLRVMNAFVVVNPDTNAYTGASFSLGHIVSGQAEPQGGITGIRFLDITLTRKTAGFFDSTDFDDDTINRGYMYLELEV